MPSNPTIQIPRLNHSQGEDSLSNLPGLLVEETLESQEEYPQEEVEEAEEAEEAEGAEEAEEAEGAEEAEEAEGAEEAEEEGATQEYWRYLNKEQMLRETN